MSSELRELAYGDATKSSEDAIVEQSRTRSRLCSVEFSDPKKTRVLGAAERKKEDRTSHANTTA